MKLRIHNQKTGLTETVEVIDEFEDVITLKNNLNKHYSTNENLRNKKLFLIYKNIVLNDDKILKFYKISDNDKISVRYLENILIQDENILEVFLAGLLTSIMYLIVRQNDSINTIRSTIGNIVQNISKIYDKYSNELSIESKIEDIDRNNEYYKLIISCDNRSIGGENQTVETCCDLHDRCLIDLYMKKFPSICRRIDYKVNWKTDLIKKIKELKEKINDSNVDKLNGILSMFSNRLVKSRFLFVTEMAEYINCCCDDLWNEIFDVSSCPVRDYFLAALHISLNEDSGRNEDTGRNIVIRALDIFENYLGNDDIDWRSLMKSLLDRFLIRDYSTNEIQQLFDSKISLPNPSINIRQNQRIFSIFIPTQNHIYHISELKLAVSFQTNVNMEYLYFIRLNSVEKPKDTDEINNEELDKYLIEIVSSMENIKKVQIIDGNKNSNFLVCQNTITKKSFGLKKPKGNEDLYIEISNYCSFNNCRHNKIYIGLFFYKNRVCLAVEFMPNGTLISLVKKDGPFHEAKVSKFSYQILEQIAEFHEEGWIHRDIKGDNFVLDDENKAVLIDFDMAIKCNTFLDFYKDSFGSLGYIAPEIFKPGTLCDNKVDIWSFGVMVIEMINGKKVNPVFGIDGPYHKELRIRTPKPISEELKKFHDSCLTVQPKNRPEARKLMKFKFIRKQYN